MERPIINIDSLTLGLSYQRYYIEARVIKKSRVINCNFSGKISYFYLDLQDDSKTIRSLFYKGFSTIKIMEKFFEDIQLDDIVFLNGFDVKKSTSDSKEINPKIQIVFNSVIYEKTTGRVMDYSEKISFNN